MGGKCVVRVLRTPPPAGRTDLTDEALHPTSPDGTSNKSSLPGNLGRNGQRPEVAWEFYHSPPLFTGSLSFLFFSSKFGFTIKFICNCLYYIFIEIFFEMIVDSHADLRHYTERSHVRISRLP